MPIIEYGLLLYVNIFHDPERTFAILQLPTGYAQALFLAFDTKGRLWFPAPMSNALEMYNTTNHTFHTWKVPTPNTLPWDVAIDHQGNVWFAEHNSNKIGRFDPATHTCEEIATPASKSWPYGITVDANNTIWFTENNPAVALIGEYTSAGRLLEHKVRTTPSSSLTPHLITVDHSGNVWWSEGFAAAIGELFVTQAVPGENTGVKAYFYRISCVGTLVIHAREETQAPAGALLFILTKT